MADLNKVFLMGRLTFDPELRRTTGGTAVTELRLATTRTWAGRDGERREETLFIDVTVWDRQAENCCQFLRKGSSVHVEGALRMDTWDDKNTGEKRSKVRVHADRVQFLDSRRGDSGAGTSGSLDDDFVPAPQASRESSARRTAPSGATRGSGNAIDARDATNGPGQPSYPAPGVPDPSSATRNLEEEEDDIPPF
jgi:single-strand DNA-binding protein